MTVIESPPPQQQKKSQIFIAPLSLRSPSKVTITSKTPSSQVAYRAKYSDGRLVPAGPGQSSDPKPCAGMTGTTILVRGRDGDMGDGGQIWRWIDGSETGESKKKCPSPTDRGR